MTLDFLDKLNIKNTYRVFVLPEEEQLIPPYAVWFIGSESFAGSDAKWLKNTKTYTVTVFTTEKDFALETLIEESIPTSEIEKTESYDYTEHVFNITYTYTVNTRRF